MLSLFILNFKLVLLNDKDLQCKFTHENRHCSFSYKDSYCDFSYIGHVHSWKGIKDLLTECESTSQAEDMFQDMKGPINPTLQSNYEFLKDFFKEVFTLLELFLFSLGNSMAKFIA